MSKGGKGKGKKDEVIDNSTQHLFNMYRKFINEKQLKMYKPLEELFREKIKEEDHINEFNISGDLTFDEFSCIANALIAVNDVNKKPGYKHINSLRVFDCLVYDEGFSFILKYFQTCNSSNLKILDMRNCRLGTGACKDLAEIMNPSNISDIQVLNLSYNSIKTAGLSELMISLKVNTSLNYLNLSYCDICSEGAYLFRDFFENDKNNLKSLDLTGNSIYSKGATDIFNCLSENAKNVKLEEIILESCYITSDEEFTLSVTNCMKTCLDLGIFNLQLNHLNDDFLLKVFNVIKEQKEAEVKDMHIYIFQVTPIFSDTIYQPFFKMMVSRKKPKKKGKKAAPKKK